jgi:GTP-binding protein LepA
LRREFNLSLVVTAPSISYEVTDKRGKKQIVYSAARFPEYGEIAEVREPMVEAKIITPPDYVAQLMPLFHSHETDIQTTENFGENRVLLILRMPLREMMRGFFDEVKSVSSGFASLSYRTTDVRPADVVKLELLVAEEPVPAFSRIVSRQRAEMEAEAAAEKLYTLLPRQLFAAKIQARALGRIISSRTVRAMAKDVSGYLYGGDRTRKMKLWQKQKEGKKRLKESGRVRIPPEVFLKMMQS